MAAVEAPAVRNRWGETSTPIASRVIFEINVPRFLVVICRRYQRNFFTLLAPPTLDECSHCRFPVPARGHASGCGPGGGQRLGPRTTVDPAGLRSLKMRPTT